MPGITLPYTTAALGVEEVPYGELLLGVEAVNRARLERGADPLI